MAPPDGSPSSWCRSLRCWVLCHLWSCSRRTPTSRRQRGEAGRAEQRPFGTSYEPPMVAAVESMCRGATAIRHALGGDEFLFYGDGAGKLRLEFRRPDVTDGSGG